MDRLITCYWHSPIGQICLRADDESLHSLTIASPGEESSYTASPATQLLRNAVMQLEQWFAGTRTTFDIPLVPIKTPRGQQLREAIAAIPYGDKASYGQLARLAASGPRAIGQACRRNRFPIIIPCHRVIAAQGRIGHYSGANGVATKAWLLDFETMQQQRNMP